jgi:Spy/CpxP family protein refolding chaperone
MESSLMPRSNRSVATVVMLALVLLPAFARGQMPMHRDNNPFSGKPAPIVPVNVARAVIEHEHDMALTDSQRSQIVLIQRRLDSTAAPLLKRIDSLKPTWRPAGGINDLSPEQRDQLVALRTAQFAVIDSLTPTFAKAREQVMSVLNPEQRDRAAKLEKNERKRAEEMAKQELEGPRQREDYGRRRGEIRDATGRAPLD